MFLFPSTELYFYKILRLQLHVYIGFTWHLNVTAFHRFASQIRGPSRTIAEERKLARAANRSFNSTVQRGYTLVHVYPFCCQLVNLPDELHRRRSRFLHSVRSTLRRTLAIQVPLPFERSEYISLGITVLNRRWQHTSRYV